MLDLAAWWWFGISFLVALGILGGLAVVFYVVLPAYGEKCERGILRSLQDLHHAAHARLE